MFSDLQKASIRKSLRIGPHQSSIYQFANRYNVFLQSFLVRHSTGSHMQFLRSRLSHTYLIDQSLLFLVSYHNLRADFLASNHGDRLHFCGDTLSLR
jgi:hypothetical protein